ncbi:MAG: pyruvate ferredoxin oxidoreductase [Prevotella sp.]|nr:pyruvate ferredoxin oxidoreductase [Prevotella sp.]
MDYKYIEQLLERYWNCETTLSEEDILRSFFSQKDVPIGLMKYKDLFVFEQDHRKTVNLGEDFDARLMAIIEEPQPVKARKMTITQKLMPLFKAAAIVAIVLTLGNAAQVAFRPKGAQEGQSVVNQTSNGKPVAMGDTIKADTIKNLPDNTILLK